MGGHGCRAVIRCLLLAAIASVSSAQEMRALHWKLDQETGVVFSGYNDVRIPGNAGTRFSFTDDLDSDSKLYYRLQLSYTAAGGHTITGTYAPLTLAASGFVDRAIVFEGVTFPPDSVKTGEYRFTSYRITYRYDFLRTPDWEAGIGATAFLRDAAVSLRDADLFARKKNRGFVPLLHFRVRRILSARTSVYLEGDALAAPQGRAEDVLLAAQFRPVANFGLKFGYRVLEGGADTDEVYTFALLHYAVVGAFLEF